MADLLERVRASLAGRYTIERELGRGGMATVYLAEDLKHHRQVAVKVLKPELAALLGPERFLHEIQVTSHLQHPHILPLFDSGHADRFVFYVMPFVDGESLRDRLSREKHLPIEEALQITRAVASALDYAHRHGVIHRDIKPENVLLHDGQALVADFGVALAMTAAGGGRLTETGLSIGTPQYMSPEQATGERQITARSDVYALGSVLYEMLVGEPPFSGPTAQAIVAKLLTEKPQRIGPRRDTVQQHVEAAVLKALAKLPADRFATALQFAEALDRSTRVRWAAELEVPDTVGSRPAVRALTRALRRPAVPWILVAFLAALVGVKMITSARPARLESAHVVRLAVRLSPSVQLDGPGLAVSPDGNVVVASAGGRLYARRLDALDAIPITGTEGGYNPFFSPDGRWVAFMTGDHLNKVPVEGGSPIVVADAFYGGGGTWGEDGSIVYKPLNPSFRGGLWRVSAAGGAATALTSPDSSHGEQGHYWPQMLPGGKAVLFTALSTVTRARIDVLALATGKRKTVIRDGSNAWYVPTGHLVFVRSGVLLAVPFDLTRLAVTGEPIPLLEDVAVESASGQAGYALSTNGVLAYVPASQWHNNNALVWVDRAGREKSVLDSLGDYHVPRISPDGRRVALISGAKWDVWICELGRRVLSRLTRREEGNAMAPMWTPDGARVIYSGQAPSYDLFWRAADGSTPEQTLWSSPVDKWASSISPDGKAVLFYGAGDLWVLRLEARPTVQALTRTPFVEGPGVWSPDGRWLVYGSNESGRWEVYASPALNPTAARRQVSPSGGVYPRWGRNGHEIVYFATHTDGRMMSAPFDPTTGAVGAPRLLFQGPYEPGVFGAYGYDVTQDGQRFLMVKAPSEAAPREVRIVVNWFEEVKGRMRR